MKEFYISNIILLGERPDVSNSPGVFSLNSVGTISPTHTPVPTPDNKPSADNKVSCNLTLLGLTLKYWSTWLEVPYSITFDS